MRLWHLPGALCLALISVAAAAKERPLPAPGARAVVVDERLSALRERPEVKAPLLQRLRRGRAVAILGRDRAGQFLRVAVTRRTRGWVLAAAVARAGRADDAARMLTLIGETADDYARARLARACADEFRVTRAAPRALLLLGEAAERAAERLSSAARRRSGTAAREYLLNDVGLDRYNRIGVTFDYDEGAGRLKYDGGAYRELLRRYPRSPEAAEARARLVEIRD